MPDYGVDVQASDDLPDPEVLCSGDTNVVYALARRLLEPADVHAEELGDERPFETMDVREWLGRRYDPGAIAELQTKVSSIMKQDERVETVQVQAEFVSGGLSIAVQAQGASGTFPFVLSVDGVSSQILVGG